MKSYEAPEAQLHLFSAEEVLLPSREEDETEPVLHTAPFKL